MHPKENADSRELCKYMSLGCTPEAYAHDSSYVAAKAAMQTQHYNHTLEGQTV
jgi:hypothetical protein